MKEIPAPLPTFRASLRSGLRSGAFLLIALVGFSTATATAASADAPKRPNILFIAMDDLRDWVGCMGGHPQAITPNIDRLARSGVLFTNAHCAAPACNPSRTSIFTGMSPHKSGIYDNAQVMREVVPNVELLPKTLSRQGYRSTGSGKMLHYYIDAPSWDDYFPKPATESPIPETLYPEKRPLSLPRAGPWQYVETDWGPLDATDAQYGGDWAVTEWVRKQLAQPQTKPFFLACGIYRPHEPWFVPKKYFEPFPLGSIQLPPGYKADDLDDLPPQGKSRGPNRYFEWIQKQGQWKNGIQAYLASIYFADTMLGRVLDALDHSPFADNTIVVLWSDHGWHLGEKEHWQKYTGWRVCTRVPLIVRVPRGAPGLMEGTSPGVCDRPVSLLSLYPTLLDLCGLPAETKCDGPSLTPLLKNVRADWPYVAYTFLADVGSYSISGERWRYIHYGNGDEELYDIQADPYEWTNLAAKPDASPTLQSMRTLAPPSLAAKPEPSLSALPRLAWQPLGATGQAPASKPDGGAFDVVFQNASSQTVQLFWMTPEGQTKRYADLTPGKPRAQKTRPGAVWLIADEQGHALGYFEVGDRKSTATVPAK